MVIRKIIFGASAAFFCILPPGQAANDSEAAKKYMAKIAKLETELKSQKALNETLREQNLVLSSKFDIQKQKNTENESALQSQRQIWPVSPESLFYSKIIDCYQRKNQTELDRMVMLFLKAYPQSVYADNALYLQAKLELNAGEFQKALDTVSRILSLYPEGDKAVSALYTKGVILTRMKQPTAAREAFHHVSSLYPGSPESWLIVETPSQGSLQ